MDGGDFSVGLTTNEELLQKLVLFFTKRLFVNSKDNSNFGTEDKKWQKRNIEDALWGSGVGSIILRSTIFGENITILRSTLLKGVVV